MTDFIDAEAEQTAAYNKLMGISSSESGETENPEDTLMLSEKIIREAIKKLAGGDVGAHFENKVIEAAKFVKQNDSAAFMRLKQEIKKANKDSQISEWDRKTKGEHNSSAEDTSQAGELVTMVRKTGKLFHNEKSECFVTIEREDHFENWMIGSGGFKDWVSYEAYTKLGFCPNDQALKQAMTTLSGIAKFDGPEHKVFLRCAPYRDSYIIDLTNESWQAVQVTPSGYELLSVSPVKFIRSNTVAPLPLPAKPDINLLWKYANVKTSDRPLLLAFMLESWRHDLPFTLLALIGEQGSGKSSAHKAVRALTDPNTVPLRAAPKDRRDVQVSAMNNWQASFENISHLPPALQDCLCYFLTGGGSAERELYTNKNESVFSAMCPVILNGIENAINRPDLVDRSVILDVPNIPAESKMAESDIKTSFEADKPGIFAGLLDLFAKTLKDLPSISIKSPQRMVDFTYLGESMLSVIKKENLLQDKELVNSTLSFNELYAANRKKSLDESISASPATLAVGLFARDQGDWSGTIKQLKDKLEHKYMRSGDGWPKSERGLSSVLKRMKPALRVNGIEVEFLGHQRDGTHVRVYLITQNNIQGSNRHNRHAVTDNAPNEQNTADSGPDSLVL